MFTELFTLHSLGTLAILVGLELILGIDNVLMINLMAGKLPAHQQARVVKIGLGLALVLRLLMLLGVGYLLKLTNPVIGSFAVKDLILLVGGAFLIYKAVTEIHHTVEHPIEKTATGTKIISATATSVVIQMVALDAVFSLDSIITAVGLTPQLPIIIVAVIVSFLGVLWAAMPIGRFIQDNPALKVLCLAFLVSIGGSLILEACHQHVSKGYLYGPMGFALIIEMLQMRQSKNIKAHKP